ncbi:hypothetical protein BHE90_004185 [Fusarium euwallaceae]|uniref:Uncharacterized protein n=1 Tax=Fusarium euwallaceae TaxID=1147111 RepID=A0A430M003_9HYPO|nr:hypothetical protein BHE90_004185 [Fusarium euwallaceae]
MTRYTRTGSREPDFASFNLNASTTASTNHGFKETPGYQSTQSYQGTKTGSQRSQTKNKQKGQDDDDFWILVAIIAFISCGALLGFVVCGSMKTTPARWPTANAINDIATSHTNWQRTYGIGTQHGDIPKLIKSCETTMTHMRTAIKHSDMRNRQSLEQEMEAFSFAIDEAITRFVAWDSLAQATVDETQNLNNHVLGSAVSWNDVSGLTGRNRKLRELSSSEGRRIGGRLQYLKEIQAPLLASLDTVGVRLRTISEFLRDEEASLDHKHKDFILRAKVLEKMLQLVTSTHRVVNNLQITVKTSGRGLERLRQAIWGIEDMSRCADGAMPLCLDNIQAAVDRLDGVWKPSKAGTQTQRTIDPLGGCFWDSATRKNTFQPQGLNNGNKK